MTAAATENVWEVLATARAIRRFSDEPVDRATLDRCLEAATWAPSGGNVQHWRFIVLDSPEMRAVVQRAADAALEVIEPVYGMSRPDADDTSRTARRDRATYELHDLAGQRTSVLFAAFHNEFASDFLQGASIFPAVQNFYLAARAQGLGACPTSWAAYDGEELMRQAIGIPDEWVLAGHVVVGWPRGRHGPVRRRPLSDVVFDNRWDPDRADIVYGAGAPPAVTPTPVTWLAAHEGFYGPPLDHEARMAMVPWLADHGYSGYAYSPKDDPRHRQRWREAYEAEEMARFAELHQACRSAGMSFVAMVSPGLDWRGDDADLDALTAKLAAFRELGVDRLSVNWDDVPGDAESTRRHGEAVATVVARLGDGVRWTTAPVDYAACPPTASLHAFAEQLPEQVAILWTGRHVVPPTVTAADHATVEGALRRKVHFAENFPVNDLVMGDVLHLGPYPERDPGLRDRVEAVYVNFMHRPLASRVGLAGAAAFWLGDDDREAAWRAAIAELPGLEALARASRSWVATPGPDATLRSLADAAVAGDVAPLRAYLEGGCRRGIVDALAAEVEPWLVQWELEAASMLEALELLAAIDGDGAGLREVWAAVARWRQLRSAAPQVFGIRFARYPVAGIRNGEVEAAAGAVVHAENLTDRLWLALLAKLPS